MDGNFFGVPVGQNSDQVLCADIILNHLSRQENNSQPGAEDLSNMVTVIGGDMMYSAGPFAAFAPKPLPPASPGWSPVAAFEGYQR